MEDQDGHVRRVNWARHPDPVLDDALNNAAGRMWSEIITNDGRRAREAARDQLEAAGWIKGRRRRTFGILLPARQTVYDVDMVGAHAYRVTQALESILDDRWADPRPLALGLIAVQAQLPAVLGFIDNEQHRNSLREMILAAIEPILGLHQAIQNQYVDMASGLLSGGGCGGGCGGS